MKSRVIKFYPHHNIVQLIEVPAVEGPRLEIITRIRGKASKAGYLRSSIALFSLLAITPLLLLNLIIVATGHIVSVQGKVLGSADSGLQDLHAAKSYLEQQQPDQAQRTFTNAMTHFEQSHEALESGTKILGELANLAPQKRGAEDLLNAAQKLSAAGAQLTAFYKDSSGLKITANGLTGAENLDQTLERMESNLLSAKDNVIQANNLLSEVSPDILPADKRLAFRDLQQVLSTIPGPFDAIASAFSLLKTLVSGDKKILFVFENNNELRAGGGFIGTFGDARINNGTIKNLHISSIYDLDGQLKETILPPYPLLSVSERWFLRDSNWFADFPSSAKKISQFYEKEGRETPDLIIALTPSLITELLKVTGPIDLPKYGLTLNSDNFVETTQIATSVNYDKVANTPKQMLADFFPVFLERLGGTTVKGPGEILGAFQNALTGKQLMIYSRNAEEQTKLESFNWAGKVQTGDRDYLLVAFSNLGGTKSDLNLQKQYKLDSTIDNSTVTNNLTITVTNPLPNSPEGVNRSFVRIYVPKGATLLDTIGADAVRVPTTDLLPNAKSDPEISSWEAKAQINTFTGSMVGEEGDATVFGFWLVTDGGQVKTLNVRYRVPMELNILDHYSLLWQKQPGSVNEQISYNVNIGRKKILWKNFAPNTEKVDTISYQTRLDKDYLLGLVMEDK